MRLNGILPPEATSRTFRAILTDSTDLLIEDHRGLISYDEACIQVRLDDRRMLVHGDSLFIHRFSRLEICIRGNITHMEFLP